MDDPFTPKDAATTTVAASTTSADEPIVGAPAKGKYQVRVVNASAALAYVKFGNGAVTATASDIPVLGGTETVFTVKDVTDVAVLLSTGTGNVHITVGKGY